MAGMFEREGLKGNQGGPMGRPVMKGRNINGIIDWLHQKLFGSKKSEWDRIEAEDRIARERYEREMAAKGYVNQGGRYYPTGK